MSSQESSWHLAQSDAVLQVTNRGETTTFTQRYSTWPVWAGGLITYFGAHFLLEKYHGLPVTVMRAPLSRRLVLNGLVLAGTGIATRLLYERVPPDAAALVEVDDDTW